MSITNNSDLVPTALWPQGDARDPLGVWGARFLTTGDATGGSIQVNVRAPASLAGAYIYTVYGVNISNLTGAITTPQRLRLLTNWPDVDPLNIGVQGFASHQIRNSNGDGDFPPPVSGAQGPLLNPSDRFILLFDPRPVTGAFDILDLTIGENVDTIVYAHEAYGYYWDRQVLNTPGGPRHPGSS